MKLSESGNRHYTDDEIEVIAEKLLGMGVSSYGRDEIKHTSYGRAIEQLKRERDEAIAECVKLRERVDSFTKSGFKKGINWLWTQRDELKAALVAVTKERDEYKAETIESAEMLITKDLQIRRMRDCVLFFSSVIKRGEAWSEECAESLKRALAKEWPGE